MDVSVIIVNYNTCALLQDCIESIKKHTVDIEYEIIIVDNDSKDDSRAVITSLYPDVTWIQSKINLGFGKANNLGATYASGKYLFLLNSDTILLNNAIKIFYEWKEKEDANDKKYGVIGGILKSKTGHNNVSAGAYITSQEFVGSLFNGLKQKISGTKQLRYTEQDVDYVMGADMFMSKSLFERIKGFDESFFMYCEEVDLQYRMSKEGYLNHLILGPEIIHLEGASFSQDSGLTFPRFRMWQNSRNIYIKKHFSLPQRMYMKLLFATLGIIFILNQKWGMRQKFEGYKLMLK